MVCFLNGTNSNDNKHKNCPFARVWFFAENEKRSKKVRTIIRSRNRGAMRKSNGSGNGNNGNSGNGDKSIERKKGLYTKWLRCDKAAPRWA